MELINTFNDSMIFLFGLVCIIIGMILMVVIQKIVKAALKENNRHHGKWILCNDTYFSKCSICGDIWLNEECKNYCPNCGSDMRSDNNGKK